ncbi:MAG: hypothetical protein ACI9T9_003022, partial [Oleiphilaceae bacterium]
DKRINGQVTIDLISGCNVQFKAYYACVSGLFKIVMHSPR